MKSQKATSAPFVVVEDDTMLRGLREKVNICARWAETFTTPSSIMRNRLSSTPQSAPLHVSVLIQKTTARSIDWRQTRCGRKDADNSEHAELDSGGTRVPSDGDRYTPIKLLRLFVLLFGMRAPSASGTKCSVSRYRGSIYLFIYLFICSFVCLFLFICLFVFYLFVF